MTFYNEQTMTAAPDPLQSETVTLKIDDYLRLLREHAEQQMMLHRLRAEPREMKQVLNYHGSKKSLAEWIISYFPKHGVYLEPFFGSGAVFFCKRPSRVEVVGDLNDHIVNFFRVLRDTPDELLRLLALTPYALSEYCTGMDMSGVSDLERARRLYARLEMGFHGSSNYKTGFKRMSRATRDVSFSSDFKGVAHLYQVAFRLQDAQLEAADAFEQILRYDNPDTLIYLDPPYVRTTRGAHQSMYEHDLDNEGHRCLAELLHASKSMVILSGYSSALYDELYSDWTCVSREARDALGKARTECLWLSPSVVRNQIQQQMFDLA